WEHRPQQVADQHRSIRATNSDMCVKRKRVVAPGDVLQAFFDAAVMLGVDDVLLAVVSPWMRACGTEHDPLARGECKQAPPPVALGGDRGGEVLATAGPDLDL